MSNYTMELEKTSAIRDIADADRNKSLKERNYLISKAKLSKINDIFLELSFRALHKTYGDHHI